MKEAWAKMYDELFKPVYVDSELDVPYHKKCAKPFLNTTFMCSRTPGHTGAHESRFVTLKSSHLWYTDSDEL